MTYAPLLFHRVANTRPPLAERSPHPALTRLVLLAAADPGIAEQLLHNESLDFACVHPHYGIALDDFDRAALADVRARVDTVSEFLVSLADVADGGVTCYSGLQIN